MSPARRKQRRRRGALAPTTAEQGQPQQQAQAQQRGPGANWNWRTFPVYFAFSLGAFLGLYLGIIASALEREGQTWVSTGIFIAIAIMLGLGLSRLTTNWLANRRFIKARQKKAGR